MDHRALAFMLLVVVAATASYLDPFGLMEQPEAAEVASCDGTTMNLSGPEAELLSLHNETRAEHGAPPLCVEKRLAAVAGAHSKDMIERDFYSHETPEGVTPAQRVQSAGYDYSSMAENIHLKEVSRMGRPSTRDLGATFEDWMESPGHRENLLNPALKEVGIGVATGMTQKEMRPMGAYTVNFGTPR